MSIPFGKIFRRSDFMGIPHYNKYRQYPPDDNKHCCGCNTVVMGNVIFVIAIFLMIFKACSN